MSGARDSDLLRRIEAMESELYGPDRNSGLKGKVADLWEWRAMGKGVAWFVLKLGAVTVTVLAFIWALITTALD